MSNIILNNVFNVETKEIQAPIISVKFESVLNIFQIYLIFSFHGNGRHFENSMDQLDMYA